MLHQKAKEIKLWADNFGDGSSKFSLSKSRNQEVKWPILAPWQQVTMRLSWTPVSQAAPRDPQLSPQGEIRGFPLS